MRHQILIHISILAGATTLLASTPAMAAPGCGSGTVPSDDSQVSQYTETVPGACGDQQPGDDESGGGGAGGGSDADDGSSGAVVPTETSETGQVGVEDTTGSTAGGEAANNGSGSQGQGDANASSGGNSSGQTSGGAPGGDEQFDPAPLSSTGEGADDGGGAGWILPLALGLTLLGAVGFALWRRFRGDGISTPSSVS